MKNMFEIINNICHTALVAVSKGIKRCRNKYGMTNTKKLVAFTLAETLIVMGIIGIVSALTLPNLNSSTGEKEKVAKVKKLYQNLEDAIGRAQAVYGPVSEWFINDTTATAQATRFGDRVTEFMKVSKNCGVTTNQHCFSTGSIATISDLQNTYKPGNIDSNNSFYKVQLADGTSLAIGASGFILINIDGIKGKNKMGNDVFMFRFNTQTNQIEISPIYDFTNLFDSQTGDEATAWVIRYDNMDYLKASTSGKCNDSNVTLNPSANPPVTSCK